MADRVAYIEAVFGADITAFRRGTTEVRRDLNLLSDVAGGLSKVGRNMTLMLSAPLIAFGTAAIKASGDFDAAMRNVNSILFASEEELASLSASTLSFGATLRAGPLAAAEALYTVVSAGFTDMNTAMQISQVSAATAEAGLADLKTTAEALAAAMLAYNASVDDAQHFSDVLTRTVQVGVGEMQEFATGIGNAVSTAVMLGISFDDLGASQAFLTQRGISAARAATLLNRAFEKLITPTEAMTGVFQRLGVSSGRELIEKFGGLEGALVAIKGVVGDNTTLLHDLFNTTQAFRAIGTITNDIDAFSAAMADFSSNVEGATNSALQQQYMSFNALIERLGSAATAAAISIGDKLVPVLRPAAEGLRQMLLAVPGLPDELVSLGVAVSTVVAGMGPFLWIVGSLITPIGLLAGAVVGLSGAIAINLGGARTAFVEFINDVTGGLGPLISGIQEFAAVMFGESIEPLAGITVSTSSLANDLQVTLSEGQTVWDAWVSQGGEAGRYTWSEFRDSFVAAAGGENALGTAAQFIQPGTYDLNLGDQEQQIDQFTRNSARAAMELVENYNEQAAVSNSFGDRFARAISSAGPLIQSALAGIGANITNWFENTFLPSVDTFGADILSRIAGGFSGPAAGEEDGDNSIYGAIRSALNGGITGVAHDLSSILQENFPGISAGLTEMFDNLGLWITDTALPSLARTFGYLSGRIVVFLSEAMTGIAAWLRGGGASDTAGAFAEFLDTSIISPFEEGFADAATDTGVADPVSGLFAALGDLLIAAVPLIVAGGFIAAVGSTIIGGITTGVGTAAAGVAVSGPLTAAVSSFASMVGGAITGALTVALGAIGIGAVVIGVADFMLNTETGKNIQNFVSDRIIDPMFGEGSYDSVNNSVELFLAQLAITIGRIAGADEFVAEMEAMYGGPINPVVDIVPELNIVPQPGEIDRFAAGAQDPMDRWSNIINPQQSAVEFDPYYMDYNPFNNLTQPGMALQQQQWNESGPRSFDPAEGVFGAEATEAYRQVGSDLMAAVMTGFGGYGEGENPLNSQIHEVFGAEGTARRDVYEWAASTRGEISLIREKNTEEFTAMTGTMGAYDSYSHGVFSGISGVADTMLDGLVADLAVIMPMMREMSNMTLPDGSVPFDPLEGRANGGSMLPNRDYLVGERGPEVLRMGSTGGFMTPNSGLRGALGGGGGSNVYNNSIVIDGQQPIDDVITALESRGIYLS